jgi:hypothetical protein
MKNKLIGCGTVAIILSVLFAAVICGSIGQVGRSDGSITAFAA